MMVVMLVAVMVVMHRVHLVVVGHWRRCVTVLVDVVGREGRVAVRVVLERLMLERLMLWRRLVARINRDTYEPAGQDVAVAVDHIDQMGGHSAAGWFVGVCVV